jgi:ABC-2 type transport system permease protein
MAAVRPAPVLVQASTAANPVRSYETYLLSLLFPATTHFALCLCVVGALGRELRDGTAGAWLHASGDAVLPAVLGKAAPYVALSLLEGVAGLTWLAAVRGDGVHGSVGMLLLGQLALLGAYAAIGLLLVGATRSMGESLSFTALYAGTSLAYAGATFPINGAPAFAVVWHRLVPFAVYARLQAAQLLAGAPWTASLRDLLTLSLFVLVPGVLGMRLFARAARDPASWGRR